MLYQITTVYEIWSYPLPLEIVTGGDDSYKLFIVQQMNPDNELKSENNKAVLFMVDLWYCEADLILHLCDKNRLWVKKPLGLREKPITIHPDALPNLGNPKTNQIMYL